MRSAQPGFTLVELLIAVTLLVMLVLVTGFIFDTTTKTINQVEANSELNVTLEAFGQVLRKDLRAIEHDGFLEFGQRQQPSPWMQGKIHTYGSMKDRSNEVVASSTGTLNGVANQPIPAFRTDWLNFYTACEQENSSDARTVGMLTKTFYGHGHVTDYDGWNSSGGTYKNTYAPQSASDYSNIATDWVILRQQFLYMPSPTFSGKGTEDTIYKYMESFGSYGIRNGRNSLFYTMVLSYAQRQCNSFWVDGNWVGAGAGSYASGCFAMPWAYPDNSGANNPYGIYEPTYYHTISLNNSDARDLRKFYALAHCADFKVQYAMAEDLRPAGGGGINWQDGPLYNVPTPTDASSSPVVPGSVNDARKIFRPGDRWPAALKVTVRVFDALDRLDDGKTQEIIVAVP